MKKTEKILMYIGLVAFIIQILVFLFYVIKIILKI